MSEGNTLALFESHHEPLYRYLVRASGDASVAEDLTQEVFVRALRYEHRTPTLSSGRAWLFRIARNLLVDRWRRAARTPELSRSESVGRNPGDPTLRLSLERALEGIGQSEREAFLLREVGGLTYLEIAEATDSSQASVRSRIYRARQQLRRALPHPSTSEPDPTPRKPRGTP